MFYGVKTNHVRKTLDQIEESPNRPTRRAPHPTTINSTPNGLEMQAAT